MNQVTNISDRQQSERQLRLQSAALNAAANAIVITDRAGRIIWVNPSFTQHTGYSFEEVRGKNPRLLKSGRQSKTFYQEMWNTILSGKVWRNTIINRRRDGTFNQEDLTITPIRDDAGTITHFVGIKQDISERRKAEDALRQSEERLQTVVENLAEGLVISELDGQLVHWNRTALEMHGFATMEECLVRLPDFEQVFELRTPAGDLLKLEEWPLARIIRGERLRDLEISLRRLDSGMERIFSYGGQIVCEPSGKRLAFVTMTDITERRGAEKALIAKTEEVAMMTQQLWQASKLATVGELAASVAHELNNPLATISLRLETLVGQLSDQDDQKKHAIEIVSAEVERMGKLVSNLLEFSRRNHQQISTLDVREEMDNSLELIEYHLRSNGIGIMREYAPTLPTIQADRQQLRQVFLNLLTNASDAMTSGGRIIARIAPDVNENYLRVEVIDGGSGITPENLAKIWDPFFTTKPAGKGTGLGLAICRRVVEEHHGSITIDNYDGAGASVTILLPFTSGGGRSSLTFNQILE